MSDDYDEIDPFARAIGALHLSAQSIIRDDGLNELQKRQTLAESFSQFQEYIAKLDAADDADEDDGDEAMADTEGDTPMCDMTDEERLTAETKMRHERAARMRRRLHKQETNEMDMVEIAKRVLGGQETRLSKKDFYDAINDRAQAARGKDQTPEQAFAKFIETADGALLYRSSKLAAQDDHAPASTVTPPTPEPTRAYKVLLHRASELRKSDAKLTDAQAFAKVYEDPANRELVAADKRERAERYASTEHIAEMRKREAERAA
jgi:hypothetical protein